MYVHIWWHRNYLQGYINFGLPKLASLFINLFIICFCHFDQEIFVVYIYIQIASCYLIIFVTLGLAARSASLLNVKSYVYVYFVQVNATKSASNTLDSRISRKQRCPPELIKYKESSGGGASDSSSLSSKDRRKRKASNECCSAFPLQIVLGTLQLLLAISLVALGSLLIVREAALSLAACGIWTGLIAAVTGSLGVVSMRKTQTAFLALSLVCIASSTLALAVSGVNLSRDLNRMAEHEVEQV